MVYRVKADPVKIFEPLLTKADNVVQLTGHFHFEEAASYIPSHFVFCQPGNFAFFVLIDKGDDPFDRRVSDDYL